MPTGRPERSRCVEVLAVTFLLALPGLACTGAETGGPGFEDEPDGSQGTGGTTSPGRPTSNGGAGGTPGAGGSGGMLSGGGGAAGSPATTDARAATDGVDGGRTDGAPPVVAPDGGPAPMPDPGMPQPVLPPQPKIVPVVMLEASGINDAAKVSGKFKLVEDHDGTWKTAADLNARPASINSNMGIEWRGRSSQSFPKKPYGVELRDAAGMATQVAMLGMPREADWVLYACYLDRTCLRNALAYTLAREMKNKWHPRMQFVEVFLNGSYQGLYNVVERIKRDKYRVDVPAPAATKAAGDLSGGYIVHIEFSGKGAGRDFKPPGANRNWTYLYPRHDAITGEQKTYLSDFIGAFETMMKGADFADAEKGYPKALDVSSWVDHAIIREFSRDIDAYRLSSYFYKDADAQGGKFHAGPVWDFDRTFGNAKYYAGDNPEGWSWIGGGRPEFPIYEQPVPFWKKLLEHPAFRAEMACRWQELRKGPFMTAAINAKLDGWVKHIRAAVDRDQAKWKTVNSLLDANVPPRGATYDAEVAFMKDWTDKRARWLDRTLDPLCKK